MSDQPKGPEPGYPVRKAEEIHEIKLAMARHAPVLELPVISTPEEGGLVLDIQRRDPASAGAACLGRDNSRRDLSSASAALCLGF